MEVRKNSRIATEMDFASHFAVPSVQTGGPHPLISRQSLTYRGKTRKLGFSFGKRISHRINLISDCCS
jgi:hypothetical protein